jgi:hypothetical protein
MDLVFARCHDCRAALAHGMRKLEQEARVNSLPLSFDQLTQLDETAELRSYTRFFQSLHKFSAGLRSGERAGHA